jgi:hypothetical protein
VLLQQVLRVMLLVDMLREVRGKVQQQQQPVQAMVEELLEEKQQLGVKEQKQQMVAERRTIEQQRRQLVMESPITVHQQQQLEAGERLEKQQQQLLVAEAVEAAIFPEKQQQQEEQLKKQLRQQQQQEQRPRDEPLGEAALSGPPSCFSNLLAVIPLVHLAAGPAESQLCLAGLQHFPQALLAACATGNPKPLWEAACGLEGAVREYISTITSSIGSPGGGVGGLPGFGVLSAVAGSGATGAAAGAVRVSREMVDSMAMAWRVAWSSRSSVAANADHAGSTGCTVIGCDGSYSGRDGMIGSYGVHSGWHGEHQSEVSSVEDIGAGQMGSKSVKTSSSSISTSSLEKGGIQHGGEASWGCSGWSDEVQQQLLLRYALLTLASIQMEWCIWLLGGSSGNRV